MTLKTTILLLTMCILFSDRVYTMTTSPRDNVQPMKFQYIVTGYFYAYSND